MTDREDAGSCLIQKTIDRLYEGGDEKVLDAVSAMLQDIMDLDDRQSREAVELFTKVNALESFRSGLEQEGGAQ